MKTLVAFGYFFRLQTVISVGYKDGIQVWDDGRMLHVVSTMYQDDYALFILDTSFLNEVFMQASSPSPYDKLMYDSKSMQ